MIFRMISRFSNIKPEFDRDSKVYLERIRYSKSISHILENFDILEKVKKQQYLGYTCKIIERSMRQNKYQSLDKGLLNFFKINFIQLDTNTRQYDRSQIPDILRLFLRVLSENFVKIKQYAPLIIKLVAIYQANFQYRESNPLGELILCLRCALLVQSKHQYSLQAKCSQIIQSGNSKLSGFRLKQLLMYIQTALQKKIQQSSIKLLEIILAEIARQNLIDSLDLDHLLEIGKLFYEIYPKASSQNNIKHFTTFFKAMQAKLDSNFYILTLKYINNYLQMALKYDKNSKLIKKIAEFILSKVDSEGNCKINPALMIILVSSFREETIRIIYDCDSAWELKFMNMYKKYWYPNSKWKNPILNKKIEMIIQYKILSKENEKQLINLRLENSRPYKTQKTSSFLQKLIK